MIKKDVGDAAFTIYRSGLHCLLDISESLGIFSSDKYSLFLRSGYRVLQLVDMQRDPSIPAFFRHIFGDVAWAAHDRYSSKGREAYHAKMALLAAEHHFLEYCLDFPATPDRPESGEQELSRVMGLMRERYPILVEGFELAVPPTRDGIKRRIDEVLGKIWKMRHGKASYERSNEAVMESYRSMLGTMSGEAVEEEVEGGDP